MRTFAEARRGSGVFRKLQKPQKFVSERQRRRHGREVVAGKLQRVQTAKALSQEGGGSFVLRVILLNFCQNTNAETKADSDPVGLSATPASEVGSKPKVKGQVLYFILKLMRNVYSILF